jgi:hypothetical protein
MIALPTGRCFIDSVRACASPFERPFEALFAFLHYLFVGHNTTLTDWRTILLSPSSGSTYVKAPYMPSSVLLL